MTFLSEKVGIVGHFHEKVAKRRSKQIKKVGKSRARLKACPTDDSNRDTFFLLLQIRSTSSKISDTVYVQKFRTLVACQKAQTNSTDPDQTVWTGSSLFCYSDLRHALCDFQP